MELKIIHEKSSAIASFVPVKINWNIQPKNDKVEDEYIIFKENGSSVKIELLFVPKNKRHLGLGKRILSSFIAYAKRLEYESVELMVFPMDSGVTKEKLFEFYRSFGFENFSPSHMYLDLV